MAERDSYEVFVEWSEPRFRCRYIFALVRFRRTYGFIAAYFLWQLCFPPRMLTPLDVASAGLRTALFVVMFYPTLYAGSLAVFHWKAQKEPLSWTYRFASQDYLGFRGRPKLLMIPRECVPGAGWIAAVQTWSGKPLRQVGFLRQHC